jgi:alpha-tubulin suppressor-like RCC1 family protein
MCGSNSYGQLGLGTDKITQAGYASLCSYFSLSQLKVKDVKCGDNHTLVLVESGKVYGFGSN